MDSSTTIWIIPSTCTFEGISAIESLLPCVQILLLESTREEIKNARVGIFLYIPQDEMQIKSLNFLKEKNWLFNYDKSVLASAEMIICVEKANVSEPQDKIIYAQKGKEQNWSFSPDIDVARLTQKQIYEPELLKKIFLGESFVHCAIKVDSPFLKAAQAISSQYETYSETRYRYELRENTILIVFRRNFDFSYHTEAYRKSPSEFIEWCRFFDQSLISLGPAVTIKKFQAINLEGNFRAILKESFEYIVIETDFSKERISIPNPQRLDTTNALIYLVITGAIESEIPLPLARGICEKKIAWDFSLDKILQIALPTDQVIEIPKSSVTISSLELNGHSLSLNSSSDKIELCTGWRRRNDRGIIQQLFLPREREKKTECKLPAVENLMRVEKRLIWMSTEQPPDGLVKADPNLLTIRTLAPKIKKCLEVWRPFTVQELEKREEAWKNISEDSPEITEIVKRIAEGIFVDMAPWPDPFHIRVENDEVWNWSPQKCLSIILPWFQHLVQAPLREEPSSLVCNFLYLIASNCLICYVWPAKIKEAWYFKFRSSQVYWMCGIIWQLPDMATEHVIEPLVTESELYFNRETLYCGNIGCCLRRD